VAHDLQIESEGNHLGARRTAITASLLMGKTFIGSVHSRNLGHLGPWGIVVDKTPSCNLLDDERSFPSRVELV
jgi:hypothetical protein